MANSNKLKDIKLNQEILRETQEEYLDSKDKILSDLEALDERVSDNDYTFGSYITKPSRTESYPFCCGKVVIPAGGSMYIKFQLTTKNLRSLTFTIGDGNSNDLMRNGFLGMRVNASSKWTIAQLGSKFFSSQASYDTWLPSISYNTSAIETRLTWTSGGRSNYLNRGVLKKSLAGNLYLFNSPNAVAPNDIMVGRIYRVVIYDSALKQLNDFRPVKHNRSEKIGFYDLLNKRFFEAPENSDYTLT